MRAPACCCAVLVAASGCGIDPAESVASRADAIIGGNAVDGGSPVVLNRAVMGTQVGMCSGVFVAPRVVVTAAHCVSAGSHQYTVFTGDDHRDPTQAADATKTFAVTERYQHPLYSAALGDNDLGVLVTATAFPGVPATLNRQAFTAGMLGQVVRIAGYGQTTAGDASTVGRRTQASTTIAGFDSSVVGFVGLPNICLFDSGGPTFSTVQGHEVVIGIHSFVNSNACNDQGVDVRVDPLVAFVDGYIASTAVIDAGVDGGADAGSAVDAGSPVANDGGVDAGSTLDGGSPSVPADGGADAGRTV